MDENIFSSGVRHQVTTNLITKNAINPRNKFSSDKRVISEEDGGHAESSHFQDNIESETKLAHLDNQQTLPDDLLALNVQDVGSYERLEKRVAFFEKKNVKDTWQVPAACVDSALDLKSSDIGANVDERKPDVHSDVGDSVQSSIDPKEETPKQSVAKVSKFHERFKLLKQTLQTASDKLADSKF